MLEPLMIRKMQARGLTIIELMVVVAVVATLAALAAPSMRALISTQRVKGVNAELVTDLQFARSEAARRNTDIVIRFRPANNCYTVFIPETGTSDCDCRRTPGANVCSGSQVEIKTVKIPSSTGVTLGASGPTGQHTLVFSGLSGGIGADEYFRVDIAGGLGGQLRTRVNQAGRPSVCSPDGSIAGTTTC
jgi:type IV fimbrial biogenesis protein FimT